MSGRRGSERKKVWERLMRYKMFCWMAGMTR